MEADELLSLIRIAEEEGDTHSHRLMEGIPVGNMREHDRLQRELKKGKQDLTHPV
jgi:hypothetical protein